MNIPKEDLIEFVELVSANIDLSKLELEEQYKRSDQKNRSGMSTDTFIKKYDRLSKFGDIARKLLSL